MNTTLITGATGHIGKAIAKAFVASGRSVLLTGRNENKLKAVVDECCRNVPGSNTGGSGNGDVQVDWVAADITETGGIKSIVHKVNEAKLGVNSLINCAGVNIDKILLRTNENQINSIINTNIIANINLSREITKTMLKNKEITNGSIINIGSVISSGNTGQTVYSTSKAALSGLTKSLAKELGSRNIRINLIEPGFIGNTNMVENINVDDIMKSIPLQRLGTANDVAELCLFLSDVYKSGYITGQTIKVDGGMII